MPPSLEPGQSDKHRLGLNRFFRPWLVFLLGLLTMALLVGPGRGWLPRQGATAPHHDQPRPNQPAIASRFDPYIPQQPVKRAAAANPAKTVDVGLHVENVYQLSLKDKTFWAEGWYWLKWPKAVNDIILKHKIPLDRIVEFTNQIEASSFSIQQEQADSVLQPDGTCYQLFRFSGKFYIDDLDLAAFPFQRLALPITMELKPDELSCYASSPYGCISLRDDNDLRGSVIGEYATINGYDVKGAYIKEYNHQYNTTFGTPGASAFDSIDTTLVYGTSWTTAFWQYIFPLLVLVGLLLIAPSLPGSLGDVRLAIPTTIMLTLIFLQLGYRAELPALSYVTYLDWLYIYAYIISIVTFVLFCWGINAYAKASDDGGEADSLRAINRVDLLSQVCGGVGLLLLLSISLFLRG